MSGRHGRVVIVTYHSDGTAPWLGAGFLGTALLLLMDTLLLSAALIVFVLYQRQQPAVFAEASQSLEIWPVILAVAALLVSGWLIARAALHRRKGRRYLQLALLLGTLFLIFTCLTPHYAVRDHLAPFLDRPFAYAGRDPVSAVMFFNFFFGFWLYLAAHALIGVLIMASCLLTPAARLPSAPAPLVLYWMYVIVVGLTLHGGLFYIGLVA